MPVATSTALLIGAAAALAGAGATVYSAETAKKGQQKALKFQKEQQAAAEAMGIKERDIAAQERKRMEGKVPDVAALLTGEQGAQGRGAASGLMTGNSNVQQQMNDIGKKTLMGQ